MRPSTIERQAPEQPNDVGAFYRKTGWIAWVDQIDKVSVKGIMAPASEEEKESGTVLKAYLEKENENVAQFDSNRSVSFTPIHLKSMMVVN